MSNKFKRILLFGKPLFTWYEILTPIEGGFNLPAESCFAYIIEGDEQDLTKSGFLAKKGTVILSLCGKTVGRSLSKIKSGKLSAIVVHFDREVLQKVFGGQKPKFWRELDHPLKKDTSQEDATALVRAYFSCIAKFFEHINVLSEEILAIKLKEIILLLLQTQESSNLNVIIRSLFSDKTFSFREVIDYNMYEPLNLQRLADMTNSSMASFKKKFNKMYDSTPARYITQKKLEMARRILTYSHSPIKEVCYECGFINPSSFSRMFKDQYGCSPTKFRKNLSEL